jgi:hypothetical protein
MDDVVSVSAGSGHSLAIKADGSLWAWGANFYGQLGDGTSVNSNIPIKIMDDVVSVVAGGNFSTYSLAIKTDGGLWAWGGIGLESLQIFETPTKILDNVVYVASGLDSIFAIKEDGSLWQNYNGFFELIQVDTIDNVNSVAVGNQLLLAIANGSLWFDRWGYADAVLKIMDDVVSIASEFRHGYAIKTDNSLWAFEFPWGSGEFTSTKIMDDVVSISTNTNHSLAIKSDGTLWAWGYNDVGQLGNGTTSERFANNPIPVKIMDGVMLPNAPPRTQTTVGPFLDVTTDRWYANAVQYAFDNGFMNGTSSNSFSPEGTVTRTQIMMVLANINGTDVSGGNPWYFWAVAWAKYHGISDGVDVTGNATREQVINMIYNYMQRPTANGSLNNFSDSASVSDWARNAMIWAVNNGVIAGANGRLNPQNNITRAELAQIIMNFTTSTSVRLPQGQFAVVPPAWGIDGAIVNHQIFEIIKGEHFDGNDRYIRIPGAIWTQSSNNQLTRVTVISDDVGTNNPISKGDGRNAIGQSLNMRELSYYDDGAPMLSTLYLDPGTYNYSVWAMIENYHEAIRVGTFSVTVSVRTPEINLTRNVYGGIVAGVDSPQALEGNIRTGHPIKNVTVYVEGIPLNSYDNVYSRADEVYSLNLRDIKVRNQDILRGNIAPMNRAGIYTGKIVVESHDNVPTVEEFFIVVVEAPYIRTNIGETLISGSGGGVGTTIIVSSNISWNMSSNVGWITPVRNGNQINFDIGKHDELTSREGRINISGAGISEIIIVKQEATLVRNSAVTDLLYNYTERDEDIIVLNRERAIQTGEFTQEEISIASQRVHGTMNFILNIELYERQYEREAWIHRRDTRERAVRYLNWYAVVKNITSGISSALEAATRAERAGVVGNYIFEQLLETSGLFPSFGEYFMEFMGEIDSATIDKKIAQLDREIEELKRNIWLNDVINGR